MIALILVAALATANPVSLPATHDDEEPELSESGGVDAEVSDIEQGSDFAEDSLGQALGLRVSARAGAWTHDRQLNDRNLIPFFAARAKIAPQFGAFDGFAEGYAQIDRTGKWRTNAVEAWARFSASALELRAGRQILVWGKADRLNPTDNLGARDYTLLTASDDEQRLGPAMVHMRWGSGNLTVDALWLPEFRPNIFPLDRSPPGVAVLPDQRRQSSSQFALKLDSSGGSVDWSVSWFRGIDRNRDFSARPAPAGFIAAIQQTYPDITVWGADATGTIGSVGWRVEGAYTDVRGADTPFVKNDNLWLVAGGDVTLAGNWNINLQYSLRLIFDYQDPRLIADPVSRSIASLSAAVNNQLDSVQNGVTARLSKRFWNDSTEAEIATIHFFETGDTAVRPKITHSIRDGVRIALGADIFAGPSLSFFGRVRSLSAGWMQLTWGF